MITTSKEPRYSYIRRISGLILMIISAITLTVSIQKVQAQQKVQEQQKVQDKQKVQEQQKTIIKISADSITTEPTI